MLGEESDLGPDEKPTSHFELYLRAMDEIGADTQVVRSFMQKVGRGEQWPIVLKELGVPHSITDFVEGTLNCALIHGSVVEVAAYFFFGREDIIPEHYVQAVVAQALGSRGGRSPVFCLLPETAYRTRWR